MVARVYELGPRQHEGMTLFGTVLPITTLWPEVVVLMEAKNKNVCMLRIDKDSSKTGHQLLMALLKTRNDTSDTFGAVPWTRILFLLRASFWKRCGGKRKRKETRLLGDGTY